MNGQINLNTKFGRIINDISKLEKNKIFVEIGTWNGQGTTYCVMDSLLKREDKTEFYSLECSYDKYLEASLLWKKILIPDYLEKSDILKILHGRIIEIKELYDKKELNKLDGFNEDWYKWYDDDINNLKKCPNVLSNIPEKIDVLILDGGEFSTLAEFNVLKNKIKNYIILDDCAVLKCKEVYNLLQQDNNWKLLTEDLNDRNGYAIFYKN